MSTPRLPTWTEVYDYVVSLPGFAEPPRVDDSTVYHVRRAFIMKSTHPESYGLPYRVSVIRNGQQHIDLEVVHTSLRFPLPDNFHRTFTLRKNELPQMLFVNDRRWCERVQQKMRLNESIKG